MVRFVGDLLQSNGGKCMAAKIKDQLHGPENADWKMWDRKMQV